MNQIIIYFKCYGANSINNRIFIKSLKEQSKNDKSSYCDRRTNSKCSRDKKIKRILKNIER